MVNLHMLSPFEYYMTSFYLISESTNKQMLMFIKLIKPSNTHMQCMLQHISYLSFLI